MQDVILSERSESKDPAWRQRGRHGWRRTGSFDSSAASRQPPAPRFAVLGVQQPGGLLNAQDDKGRWPAACRWRFNSEQALALAQAALQAASQAALLELVCEACGTYQTRRTGVDSAYDVPPLACTDDLRAFVARNPSLDGAGKLARALRYAADDSASARETKQALVLGLPLHEGEGNRLRDSRRTNALMAMGWTVIGVTNDELDSLAATAAIARTIRRHLGKRSQFRIDDLHARKLKLRRQLGLGVGYE